MALPIVLIVAPAWPAVPASAQPATKSAPEQAKPGIGPTHQTGACLPANQGYLRARLRGASSLDIDWHGSRMQCEGDPRADQRGMRMTFVGTVEPGHHRLRFVFGIDAPPRPGQQREIPTNLTLIFEGEQRLYATRGAGQCTIDVLQAQRLPGAELSPAQGTGHARLLRVTARGFCVGPASALESVPAAGAASARNAEDQLLVSRFDFAGALRLN